MATDDWNSIDKFEKPSSEYYCAFLDILGYKEKSERYFNGHYNLLGRFKRALSDSFAIIKISSVLIDLRLLDVKFFSDSIMLSVPKSEEGSDMLFGLLHTCKVLSAHLSFEGLFVRGGLSVGVHEDFTDDEFGFHFLASSSLQEAYRLESESSIYPRILISEKVISNLSSEEKTLIIKDDNEHMIHFAPQLINSEGENQDIVLAEMKDIQSLMNSQSERIFEKYQWMLDYYYWTLTTSRNTDLTLFHDFIPVNFRSFSVL